jgi:GNAT superfamily N-acetyltransferase
VQREDVDKTRTQLIAYDPNQHRDELERLLTAYLSESAVVLQEIGFEADVAAYVADDLGHPERFRPPHGYRVLVTLDGVVVGCGGIRLIGPGIAEIKRMYLQPDARGHGLGRILLDGLLAEARRLGCHEARLDSPWFATDAHRLYRAAGFSDCAPYPESEVPADFDPRWVYMRRNLTAAPPETPATGQSPRN